MNNHVMAKSAKIQLYASNFTRALNHIIVLDFEDYMGCQIPFASEIGAVRIVNSVIVQSFHALIAPTADLYALLKLEPRRNGGVKCAKKITGIGFKDAKTLLPAVASAF